MGRTSRVGIRVAAVGLIAVGAVVAVVGSVLVLVDRSVGTFEGGRPSDFGSFVRLLLSVGVGIGLAVSGARLLKRSRAAHGQPSL
jgi:hypothetical protein